MSSNPHASPLAVALFEAFARHGGNSPADHFDRNAAEQWMQQALDECMPKPPAAPGIDLEQFRELHKQLVSEAETAELNELEADSIGLKETANRQALRSKILFNIAIRLGALIDASPKGGSTDSRALKLPCLPFAVFDEFGVGADDRVADYGRACAAAAMQATSAEVGA